MRGRGFGVLTGALAGTGALVAAQALYATRRRDLPTVIGVDASGCEGDPAHPTIRVGAAGDSTLTGPGLDDAGDVWLRQALRQLAAEHGRHFELRSFAVGGSRMRHVLHDQLDELLAFAPDVAVVVVGTNDAIHCTPLAAVHDACSRVVTRVTREVPAVLLGGVGDLANIARVQWPLAAALRRRGRSVDAVIRSVAARHENVHYVDVSLSDADFRRGGPSLFVGDLFHPNRAGHAVWAGVSRAPLERALQVIGNETFRR
jgi:lysophospholipase L1-like esterase